MENKNNMVPDEQLEQVSGGAGTRPAPRYAEDDLVKVTYSTTTGCNYGRISDCEYDEELGQWTYAVEYGSYAGNRWVGRGCSNRYFPEEMLSPLGRWEL